MSRVFPFHWFEGLGASPALQVAPQAGEDL